jgi:hypothetical protein
MASKSNRQIIRASLINKYFLAALVSFCGVMWILDVTKGIGSAWPWYWAWIYAGVIMMLLLGVGILLVLSMFQVWLEG